MKLDFIPLDKLVVSKANMRYGKKAPDVSDILPTVRSRGVIQPVIVRPNCAPDGFEIVAGSRRFHAAKIVAEGLVMIDEVEVIKYVGRGHERAGGAHPGIEDRLR